MPGRVNGFSLAYTAVGGIVLWSGIKGETISDTFRGLLKGQPPSKNEQPITGTGATSTATAGAAGPPVIIGASSGSQIADDALKYVGSPYVWGGSPGPVIGTDQGTDCSGFVNMVIGRDLSQPIPGYKGGTYNGTTHGPTSQLWLLWGGATTIQRAQAQPGDLACWITHIGIFTDAGQSVVSALDTQSGVVVTSVSGATPTGEPLAVRRLNG